MKKKLGVLVYEKVARKGNNEKKKKQGDAVLISQ